MSRTMERIRWLPLGPNGAPSYRKALQYLDSPACLSSAFMEIADRRSVRTALAVDNDGPAKTQWLPNKGRTLSPPLKRVIVYNREDKSMQVKSEDSLKSQLFLTSEFMC